MLKIIHKHQKVTIVVLFVLASSMLFFGVNLEDQQSNYAIKINDHIISYTDFSNESRLLENQLRRQYGQAYDMIAQNPEWSINQQVINSLIPKTLLNESAEKSGLQVSNQELIKKIQSLFPGDKTIDSYSQFLKISGNSAANFEETLRRDLKREQIIDAIKLASFANEFEALALWKNDNKKLEISLLSISYEDTLKNITDIASEDLQKYYEDNVTDFETEEKVKYDYLKISEELVRNIIEVSPEDIELYYSENENDFLKPREAKVKQIKFDLPNKASEEKKSEVKKRAEEALGQALAGVDFEELQKQYSTNKAEEGTWILDSKEKSPLQQAVFELDKEGITQLVESDKGFVVAKVEEFKARETSSLEEVKDLIVEKIKEREAYAYTSIYAEELFEEWQKSTKSLAEFAKEKQIPFASYGLANNAQDPEGLNGLSTELIASSEEKQRLLELNQQSVLAEIVEYKAKEFPKYEDVKAEVLSSYKEKKVAELLREKADEVKALIESGESFTGISSKMGLKLKDLKDLASASSLPKEYNGSDLAVDIFKNKHNKAKSYQLGKDYVFYEVKKVIPAKEEDYSKDKDKYLERQSGESQRQVFEEINNQLKAAAEIDVRV